MPRKDSGHAPGKTRTRTAKRAAGRAVAKRTGRSISPPSADSLDTLARLTRRVLLDLARREGLRGRSRLKKEELVRALGTLLKLPVPEMQAPGSAGLSDWESVPLPDAYGKDRLVLMSIDPYWVHAYWEIAPRRAPKPPRSADTETGQPSWILRVYDVTFIDFDGTNAHSSFDIRITPEARNWYINLWSAGKSLCAELGLLHPDGTFSSLVRSNVIQTPPAWVSPDTEERWVRVEWEQTRHLPVQAPGASETVAPVPRPGPQEPSGGPGTGAREVPRRSQESLRAEEYRRFLEEGRRLKILMRDAASPPPTTPAPMAEPGRGFDTGLSSLEVEKKR